MKKIKHIMKEIRSIILVISSKSKTTNGLIRFKAKIHAYSKIANIIMD